MTDIDLTPMNEATARALFAEDLAEQCIRRQPETTAEKAAAARIQFRNYALNSWDTGTVNDDTVYRYRELALAATLTTWKDVARQAWQQGHETPRDYVVDMTLGGDDPHVFVGPSQPNPYEEVRP